MKNISYLMQQLFMIKRILFFVFDPNNVIKTNSVVAFKNACDSMQSQSDIIDKQLSNYKQVLQGIAKQKRLNRKKLAGTTYTIMSSVRAYAIKIGNNDLEAKMKVSLSILEISKYEELILLVMNAIDVVEPLVPQLENYNVLPQTIVSWKADLKALKDLLTGPQSAIVARKTLGKAIQKNMDELMYTLRNTATPLVSNFMSDFEYFNGYYDNLRINHSGIHHNHLNATVTDEVGKPYYGIIVQVNAFTDIATGKTYEAVSNVTNAEGKTTVSEFFPGMRTVTISGTNIETTTFEAIKFSKGKGVDANFTVKPKFDLPAPLDQKQKELVKK